MFFVHRWRSKGKSLQRIWCLRTEILEFLESQTSADAQTYLELLNNRQKMCDMAFLVDILAKLNDLNLKLQGNLNCNP